MDNLLERIARHADIDTRRAMGFPPRKLNVNFELPQWTRKWTAAWGGQVVWRNSDSVVWREFQFDLEAYRCGKTGTIHSVSIKRAFTKDSDQ